MNRMLSVLSRLLVAQIFVISGCGKLVAYGATAAYLSSLGIPLASLVTALVILIELGGGLALLVGFQTRWVATIVALFTVATALLVHNNLADQGQAIHFMKNLAIAGGLLWFAKYGPGEASVDGAITSSDSRLATPRRPM